MELSQHSPGMFDTLLELESKWREPRLLPIVYGKQEFALLYSLFHASERMQMASTLSLHTRDLQCDCSRL
jgi:hypothetical protein